MKVIRVSGTDQCTGNHVAKFFSWYESSKKLNVYTCWASYYGGRYCTTLDEAKASAIAIAQDYGIVDATAECL